MNTTSRILLPNPNKKFTNIEINESKDEIKDYFEIYFIESHLKNEDGDIEILLDSSNKYLKQLKKINQKQVKDNIKQEYIINVYNMILKPSLIKKKEKIESDKMKTINIKIYLKKIKINLKQII